MMIVVGQNAYIQKYAVLFMMRDFHFKPWELLNCICFNEDSDYATGDEDSIFCLGPPLIVNGVNDAVSFGAKTTTERASKILKEHDFILDFKEHYKLSVDELRAKGKEIADAHNRKAEEYYSKDKAYQKEHKQEIAESFDQCNLMCEGINLLIGIKLGKIQMPELPEGVTLKELEAGAPEPAFKESSETTSPKADDETRKTGFFDRIFGFFRRGRP